MKKLSIILVVLTLFFTSCTKEVPPYIDTSELEMIAVNYLGKDSVNFVANMENPYKAVTRGFCWSKNPNPTLDDFYDTILVDGSNTMILNTNIKDHDTYYVRAYFRNKKQLTYSSNQLKINIFNKHFVGENFGGGIIFYMDTKQIHGMVVCENDLGTFKFGCNQTPNPNNKTHLGAGQLNTEDFTKVCKDSLTAMNICQNLILNSYNDWFLPSKDELNLLYENKLLAKMGGKFYWSSSQVTSTTSWVQDFFTGQQSSVLLNTNNFIVRAIRQF